MLKFEINHSYLKMAYLSQSSMPFMLTGIKARKMSTLAMLLMRFRQWQ